MPASADNTHLLEAEHAVEEKAHELKKELRLPDLVLSQFLYITAVTYLGAAGKLGSAHILYWIPAVLLFYIPSGIVVVHLNQQMPIEGGLYQWAKLRFGDLIGFLVALNLWMAMLLNIAGNLQSMANNFIYIGGAAGAWINATHWFGPVLSGLLLAGLVVVGIRGLGLGKWIHNLGGIAMIAALLAMVALSLPHWLHHQWAVKPIGFSMPALSILNLGILGRMGFGAFCGFDGNSVFASECKDPNVARTIRSSIFVSGPLITLFYIVGTACVLTFSNTGALDLASPAMQVFSIGARTMRIAAILLPVAALLFVANAIAGTSFGYSLASRLPMVAGWDHLLPAWFCRLHPRYKTPVGSVIFLGAATFAWIVFSSLGVGAQEAFQSSSSASLTCWSLTYAVMFAIPLIGRGERASLGVILASISGLIMTLLYTVLSVVPIVEVANALAYSEKVGGIALGINLAGVLYFRRAIKQKQALAAS